MNEPRQDLKNFAQLQEDIRATMQADWDLERRVAHVVSYGGRYPLEWGLASLSSAQRAALEVLGARRDFVAIGSPQAVHLGMKVYGRLILEAEPRLIQGDMGLDALETSPFERQEMARLATEYRSGFLDSCRAGDDYLAGLSEESLKAAVEGVRSALDHIDPVLMYVEEKLYTLFGVHNNLLQDRKTGSGPWLFSELGRPPGEWDPRDRAFVYCLHCLKWAGFRGEEFNGTQLKPTAVAAYFDEALGRFSAALDREASWGGAKSLTEKAEVLRKLKLEVRRDHVICRHVHGLNFSKREGFFRRREIPSARRFAEEDLSEFLWDSGRVKFEGDSLEQTFKTWILSVVDDPRAGKNEMFHPLEEFVHKVVECATERLASDVGMSRSLRDYRRWIRTLDEAAYDQACQWPTTEYFCCVAPSKPMKQALSGKGPLLYTILNAISQRMDYNSWHYVPGHFTADGEPEKRHYYFPPGMPDTAEWSSLHHAGHILSTVLFSIRAPGPVRCRGREFTGFFDLRLMRQSGKPYSQEDLKTAVAYSQVLRDFYQALMSLMEETPLEFRFNAFTKTWFQQCYMG